ncbi:MAG TPA: NAD-dependent epimerase/dehydratase family protein [Solirubrobacteraceae bacterium]|jgi:nucleoside-diphosphate-sugar epimerase|nr:NAD-dependent epimerase/dehydratase family protein [Solirubrobacteraceae bacterium]
MAEEDGRLVVAVTGPTGTFGFGLMPLLEDEPRIGRIVGIARRKFDPAEHGWTKLEYRQGDVRDEDALRQAFAGADVVVHLAFMITGTASHETIRAINVDGTLNAFRAARDAGAKRFVYASSVAAYGFHRDNPVGMSEEWPTRPAGRLFYAREKAELEQLLEREAAAADSPELYLLRPPVVIGPHAAGAKGGLPEPLAHAGSRALDLLARLPLPVPMLTPNVKLQFIHEDDVGQAIVLCVLAAGPPGAYNIAGDGVVSGADVARELGLAPIPIPGRIVETAARAAASLPWPPFMPASAEWVEAFSHPAIMDTSRAKRELGWQPRFTGVEALRKGIDAARRL